MEGIQFVVDGFVGHPRWTIIKKYGPDIDIVDGDFMPCADEFVFPDFAVFGHRKRCQLFSFVQLDFFVKDGSQFFDVWFYIVVCEHFSLFLVDNEAEFGS